MKRIITVQDVADVMDHSLLRPDITMDELKKGCDLARDYRCVDVCVRPSDIEFCCRELAGTDVLVTTVIGFPHGTCTTETKLFEIKDAANKGAVEVDMVQNIARFLSGDYAYVEDEIARAAETAHGNGALIKIIFENYYLTDDQKIRMCDICKRAGVDFIKSSTGYAGGGATLPDMKLMCDHAQGMKVKAAGGIRTLDTALALMAMGVVRCGTRASEAILKEAMARAERGELFLEC